MWSALLHDIGKATVTTKDGHAPGHNEAGVKIFNQEVKAFIPDKQLQKYIKTMIFYHMHLMNMVRNEAKDYSYFKILKGIDGIVTIEDLILITKCDKLGRYKDEHENINRFDYVMKEKMARLSTKAQLPLVDGYDLKALGIEPSSKYSELLDWAYDLQLRGHSKAAILKMVEGR
jgi:tRNA nucleotidyltransferase (CCA-adding enzyme)